MKDGALVLTKAKLDNEFSRFGGIPSADFALQSDFARYLCVRTTGFFEACVKHIFIEGAKRRSAPTVASYVERQVGRLNTIDYDRLLNLSSGFSKSEAASLATYLIGARKDALDSLIAVRHLIAHGRDSGISHSRVSEYRDRVIEILDELEAKFL